MTIKRVSVRTCLGCGQKREKAELVRIGVTDGKPVVDERRTLHGRGGYLCPRAQCAGSLLNKKGKLSRALRVSCSREAEEVVLHGLLRARQGEE